MCFSVGIKQMDYDVASTDEHFLPPFAEFLMRQNVWHGFVPFTDVYITSTNT